MLPGKYSPEEHYLRNVMELSLMESMTARDSTRTPWARSASPPPWKPFSTAMAAPTSVAPAQ